jgi:hydroxymethylglutaryl-CoA lyase
MKQTPISLIECPRDAMQGWPRMISTTDKIRYINSLLQVGFDTLDFGSFVSPKAIPQMSDTRQVLAGLDKGSSATKLLAIVANIRGAEDAAVYDAIDFLGFPFSVSPTFQLRNTNSTMEESVERVDAIHEISLRNKKELVVYLSMGFGNPYGDDYNEDILIHWADEMAARGIRIISLADTVGLATPEQISFALQTLIPRYPDISFGVHLHASPHQRIAKLDAAFSAGCRRFDGALKGIGGCPMAQDELVGNMDTIVMIDYFEKKGLLPNINNAALDQSMLLAAEIFT